MLGRTSSVFALAISISVIGQQHADDARQRHPATYKGETRARVIDVVVRDKKGKPVADLSKADFRLEEDGVEQDIVSVTSVSPENAAVVQGDASPVSGLAHPAHVAAQSTDKGPVTSVTALMFERLSPESRALATDTAVRLFGGKGTPDDAVGVFVIDLTLRPIQNFTTDLEAVRKAAMTAATLATSYYEPNRIGINLPTAFPTDISQDAVDEFAGLTRIQGGYATLDALEAVITALSHVAGRRSIIFFSDGLPLQNDAVRTLFESMVAAANRSNVSVYPIDVAGLRVHSQITANAQALREAALADMNNTDPLGGGSGSAAAQYIMRTGDTSSVFQRLALRTGGFVVEDTNDLTSRAAAIQLDRRYYYLLMYEPRRQLLDDTWRKVVVTVPHRKVTVRAKAGYFATR